MADSNDQTRSAAHADAGIMALHKIEGAMLDAAVAKAEGLRPQWWCAGDAERGYRPFYRSSADDAVSVPAYSTNWAQGGPIIEREQISITFGCNQAAFPGWSAQVAPLSTYDEGQAMGRTPLIAAMRAYVASKLTGL